MAVTLRDDDIVAEARSLIRERIQESGWYPNFSREERSRLIEQDVERHWHLMIKEATRRLCETSTQDSSG